MKGKFAAATFPFFIFNNSFRLFFIFYSYICKIIDIWLRYRVKTNSSNNKNQPKPDNTTNQTTMIRTFTLLILGLMAAAGYAQSATDWGHLVPEQEYSYERFVPVSGYYTPAKSGVMRCYSTGSVINAYTDAERSEILEYSNFYYGASGESVRVYNLEEGNTVYFGNNNPLDAGTFRISVDNEEIKLGRVIPEVSETPLSISTEYKLSVIFNVPVKCTKCRLEVNGESAEINPDIYDSLIEINWFATLRQWYREGKISAGDILSVTFTGLRDINDSQNRPDFGEGAGKLVLRYTMAGRPAELVSQSGTPNSGVADMKTYYLPNGDEGLVKLVFSDPLDPTCRPKAEIQYGDQDNIELGMYFEYPPVSIDGETLTVDLRGVTRIPEELVPGLPARPEIYLYISNIRSTDGQYVLTGTAASPVTFGYRYNVRKVLFSIAADWVPVSGSALAAGTPMEIWVLNGKQISFDTVDFSYMKDGVAAKVSVPYSELKVETDPYDPNTCSFFLEAPALDADADSEINVSFGGLLCADGLDHTSDIFVRYKADTSGVEAVEAADSDAVYFDLTGRRVLSPSKGIYISDGKKIVIK